MPASAFRPLTALVLGSALFAADAQPAPAPAPNAPAATEPAPAAQPEVNQSFLQQCVAAASALVEGTKASGTASKIGGLIGSSKPDDKSADQAKTATGLKADFAALRAGKKPAADGPFMKLVIQSKDGIATAFKGSAIGEKLQSAFTDPGIGKSLLDATPVDKVPGYQKSVDALKSIAP